MARHKIKADVAIKTAKPMSTMYRLNDGDGLYLLVKLDGAKWWRFDYLIGGKRKTLSVGGAYPDTLFNAANILYFSSISKFQAVSPLEA